MLQSGYYSAVPPLYIGVAELVPGEIAQHSYVLARLVSLVQGRSPDFHVFRGHSHASVLKSLGTLQQGVTDELLRFIGSL
jgi:hypothetical protein